jgi:hypothetical protein
MWTAQPPSRPRKSASPRSVCRAACRTRWAAAASPAWICRWPSMGNLSINSPTALAIDNASAQSNGSYTRFSYGANRLQRFTDSTFLALSMSGQTASKNLDSSEKFSLGGINGVRAYPQGEASGDEGYRGTVELRHNVIPNVQATVFYDGARSPSTASPSARRPRTAATWPVWAWASTPAWARCNCARPWPGAPTAVCRRPSRRRRPSGQRCGCRLRSLFEITPSPSGRGQG